MSSWSRALFAGPGRLLMSLCDFATRSPCVLLQHGRPPVTSARSMLPQTAGRFIIGWVRISTGRGQSHAGGEMTDFDTALTGFAALDEDALSGAWSWRDGRMDVRYALYRTLEDAQEAYVRVSARTFPESRRILA